eukprot:1200678-Prymnesium_polylepis.3
MASVTRSIDRRTGTARCGTLCAVRAPMLGGHIEQTATARSPVARTLRFRSLGKALRMSRATTQRRRSECSKPRGNAPSCSCC